MKKVDIPIGTIVRIDNTFCKVVIAGTPCIGCFLVGSERIS